MTSGKLAGLLNQAKNFQNFSCLKKFFTYKDSGPEIEQFMN